MDEQAPAPVAANDAEAKAADIIVLANNAREAASALEIAVSDIESKRAASAEALTSVNQIVAETKAAKTAADDALASGQAKLEEMKAAILTRENEILQSLSALEVKLQAKTAELEQAAAASIQRIDQSGSEVGQRSTDRLNETSAASTRATENQQAAASSAAAAAAALTQVQQLLAEVEAIKTTVVSHQAVTAEAMAGKQKFDAEATTLIASEQDKFHRVLTDVEEFQKKFAEACVAFDAEIKRLIAAADGMLFGATNAGLGAVYKDEEKAADRNLLFCTVMFLVGICAFGFSLIPLVNYMSHVAAGHEMTLANVVARGLMALPASWLCLHFARRIHAAYELRQHWAHKYTVAATVEPFRRQAGEHASAAVLATLEQLMKNPAVVLRRHQKMGDPPSEIITDATKPVTDTVRKLLSGPGSSGT